MRWIPVGGSPPQLYFGDTETLYAFDVRDGTERWRFSPDGIFGHTASRNKMPAPVVGPQGTVYIGDNTETLYALNPDGTTKWASDLDIQNGDRGLFTATIASTDTGNRIYLGTVSDKGSSQRARLVALNEEGETLWVKKRPRPGSDQVFEQLPYPPIVLNNGTMLVFNRGFNTLWAYKTPTNGLAEGPWTQLRHDVHYQAQADTKSTETSSDDGTAESGGQSCLVERSIPRSWTSSLRSLRDAVLLETAPGRTITRTYYGWFASR